MQGTPDVFVSYSHHDQKLANAIVAYLEEKQVRCFIASRDIVHGRTYPEEIMKNIIACKFMVVVLTKRSNTSDNVRNEIERAFNLKKTIILFRAENITLSASLEYFFAAFHWLDAVESAPTAYFERLYCAIKELPLPPLPRGLLVSKKALRYLLVSYFVITLTLLLIWGIPILRDNAYISRANFHGIRLVDAMRHAGISDIEDKNSNLTPPVHIYQSARREIFIAGITNKFTIHLYKSTLDSAMQRGVKVKLLFLDPHSADTNVVRAINKRGESFSLEFEGSRTIIRNDSEFFHNPNLSLKFVDKIPTFIGVMIDGDVEHMKDPSDTNGVIRIVPYLRSPMHDDWVLQFSKSNEPRCTFNDYAHEFRYIWNDVAKPHPEYFQ